MCPFDFAASYAYKQVPPPKQPKPEPEDEWMDEEEVVTSVGIESRNEALLSMVSTSATNSNLQCSSRSSSHSTSQDNSHSSTPNSHRHHFHAGRMDDIDTRLAALTLDVTPRCVAAPCREVLDVTCQDAAQDQSTSALVNIVKLQNQVIEKQNAQHVLDQQVHTHLKAQLANRDIPHECCGGVLKHGYGALDAETLDALEAEAAAKKAEEEEKQRQKEQEREERQHQKDEAAIAKAMRAAEAAQQKLDRLAEKE